jgi:DNA repair protein RecO (recombination protein O)
VERCTAILIRLTKLTDTSLIVHWFSAEHGMIKTVAKGARNPKSPFAGQLDLFFSADISWVHARVGELHTLKEVQVTECRESIRGEYNAMLLSAYCCRLFEQLIERDHPEPELFDLLKRALDHIATDGASVRALRHFEHETARILGLSHDRKQAAPVLREMLGGLPPQREQLLERLSGRKEFPFPESDSGDLK